MRKLVGGIQTHCAAKIRQCFDLFSGLELLVPALNVLRNQLLPRELPCRYVLNVSGSQLGRVLEFLKSLVGRFRLDLQSPGKCSFGFFQIVRRRIALGIAGSGRAGKQVRSLLRVYCGA